MLNDISRLLMLYDSSIRYLSTVDVLQIIAYNSVMARKQFQNFNSNALASVKFVFAYFTIFDLNT